MVILQDKQEKRPFVFKGIKPPPTVKIVDLKTGDYSLEGYENRVTIERKSLNDLFLSLGKYGRARFEREFQRMANFHFAALVIEADWQMIIRRPPVRSKLPSKNVYRTLVSWSSKYGVHVWACPNKTFAARTTYVMLEKWWKNCRGR